MIRYWKYIKGYEGKYKISNYGEVVSLHRFKNNHTKLQEVPMKKIKPYTNNKNGYVYVYLCNDYPEYIYLSELIDLSNLNDNVETTSDLKTLDKIETYYDDQEWIKTKNGSGLGLFTQAGSKFLLNKLNEVIDYVKEIEKIARRH